MLLNQSHIALKLNKIVIKDMKKILKKYNVKKDVDKLYKEFEEKEGRGYI